MLKTSLDLHDNFSATIHNIIESVNLSVRTMEGLHQSVSTPLDSSALDDVRNSINQATMDIQKLDDAFTKVSSESIDAPKFDNTWVSPNFEVFTNSGVDRFNQEILSTNNLLNKLNESQMKISNTASQIDILPNAMIADINAAQVRIEGIKSKILEIENNPLSVLDESTNYQLESLRNKLSQAVDEQQALNIAVENMDIESANRAYLKLSNTIGGAEMHIRDNLQSQDKFNKKLNDGFNLANQLTGSIKSMVGAYLGVQSIKKAFGAIKEYTDLYNIQTNAENQLRAVLRNTLDAGYVAQFEAEAVVSTDKAISDINAIQDNIEPITVQVSAGTKALNHQFDIITKKASEIQSAGIYGDEAMIAGAAEFATYFSDVDAITTMMDTLADYAMGMSGGGEVDLQSMVNYATGLGKIMTGSYESMTKKGFEFTDAQKAVIEGTATHQQLVSVLGDDYASMSEEMRAASAISQVIQDSWGGLYQTMSDTPQGKIIQLNNALGDMKEVIGGQLYPYVLKFVDAINNNWGVIEGIASGITVALQIMCSVLSFAFNIFMSVARVVVDNWSWISPIVYAIATALGVYVAILGIYKGVQLLAALSQMLFNKALALSPLTQFVLLLGLVVGVVFVFANSIAQATGVANSGFSLICGAINVVIQFFVNLFKVAANIGIGIGNVIDALAHNMETAFSNSIANIQSWFYNLLSTALDVVAGICAALNKLPFIDFDYSGITNKANEYANKAASLQENKGEYKSIIDAFNEGFNTFDAFSDGWVEDAFNSGAAWGDSIGDKFSNILDGLGFGNIANLNGMDLSVGNDLGLNGIENSLNDIGSGVKDTAGNTGAIRDSLQVSEEDLKYLRDIAERETINRFTTAEIKVDMGGITNNVSSGMDLDGIIHKLATGVQDAMEKMAEGVHV